MYGLRLPSRTVRCCVVAAFAVAAVVVGCARIDAAAGPPTQPAPSGWGGAEEVALRRSGAATFTRLRTLIDAARVTIHVEIYEFGQRSLADALIAAKSRGVSVTVIDDPSELTSVA